MRLRGHWSTAMLWRRISCWGLLAYVSLNMMSLFLGILMKSFFSADFFNTVRSILLCWVMALIPTVPLWFDQTTADAWQDRTDCKCFYPISNVSVTWKYQECIFDRLSLCGGAPSPCSSSPPCWSSSSGWWWHTTLLQKMKPGRVTTNQRK